MSKQQKTNNNKGPANRRPSSSNSRSTSGDKGKSYTKSSGSSASFKKKSGPSSSRDEDRSSRSGFDKKPAAKRSYSAGRDEAPDYKKRGGDSGRSTSSRSGRTSDSNDRSSRSSYEKKPVAKRSFNKEESNTFKKNRSESGSAGRTTRSAGSDARFSGRSSSYDKKGAKRSFGKEDTGRPARPSRSSDKDERSSPYDKKTPAKRSFSSKEDSFGFKKKSSSGSPFGAASKTPKEPYSNTPSFNRKRRSSDADEKPVRRKSAPDNDNDLDNDSDDDFFLESNAPKKPKFDKDEVKRGKKSYENKLDKFNRKEFVPKLESSSSDIRLNKYISNSGICSRREADQLIIEGLVKVNNVVVTELGYKVKAGDVVKYNNKVLNPEKPVYVMLNKPKDFITTMEDEGNRKTVMLLVANATKERIYPVGRLDRNTTGLLLFTNDGEFAQKLTHPSNKVKKIYEVEIDKPITPEDFEKISEGKIHLFDGPVKVDEVAIISPSKKILGIEIHEGRNRIVRRIFESLGYEVVKLDRVMYAGLTKKNLPRGSWRYLTSSEVNKIKYLD